MERRNLPPPRPKGSPKEKIDVAKVGAFVRQVLDDSRERLERVNNLQRRGRRLRPSPSLKAVK